MQIHIFNVPLTDSGESMADMRCIEPVEMNRFLAGHKVLEVEQRLK